MNKIIYSVIAFAFLLLPAVNLKAQCEINNDYFQSGEVLNFDLYFKYGIIYKKAGVAALTVSDGQYNGTDVHRLQLTARSTGLIKSFYTVNDTLASIVTKDFIPLAYSKDAHEDGDYNIERGTYDYSSGKSRVRNVSIRNGRQRYDTTYVADNCMYDVISIIYYARTLDYDNMKKGDRKTISFFAGSKMMNMDIVHQGIDEVKANDGREYYCIKLSLKGSGAAFEDKNEAMKVYLTNDANRIPVRIESKLKIGTARVVLRKYQEQRN